MVSNAETTPWLVTPQPNTSATIRLFCFPHAGAGASAYRDWVHDISPAVELRLVQYPGREERFSHPLHRRLETLIPELSEALVPYLDKPFVFFGHSMGAGIAHHLLTLWQQQGYPSAEHLIVSGARAPQLAADRAPKYQMNDASLLDALRKGNGIPEEVLQNAELMRLLMPRLRADIELAETMPHVSGAPLQCPVTAYGGVSDPDVRREDINAWRVRTASSFNCRLFPGDHFFIHSSRVNIINAMNDIFETILQKGSVQSVSVDGSQSDKDRKAVRRVLLQKGMR